MSVVCFYYAVPCWFAMAVKPTVRGLEWKPQTKPKGPRVQQRSVEFMCFSFGEFLGLFGGITFP